VDDDDDEDIPRGIQKRGAVPDTDDDEEIWSFTFGAGSSTALNGNQSHQSKPANKRQKPSISEHYDTSDVIELSD